MPDGSNLNLYVISEDSYGISEFPEEISKGPEGISEGPGEISERSEGKYKILFNMHTFQNARGQYKI